MLRCCRKSTPFRWSSSWHNARASRFSPRISNVSPLAFCALTVTNCGRTTYPRNPGIDRQPSSSRTSPSAWMISGFTITIFASGFLPVVTSTTAKRRLFPICGAARPTPCDAYMVANISSASCASCSSNFLTTGVGFSSTGSPYLTILWIVRTGACAICGSAARTSPAVTISSELVDLLGIAVEIPPHLGERISSKFLQKSIREHKCHHCFSGNTPGRHHAPVGTLVSCLHRLLGHHVHGAQRLAQRRNGLQESANDHILPIGDAALEPARAIRGSPEFPRALVIRDFVLHFAAEGTRGENPGADLDGFNRLHAHQRLRQPAVQLFIPLCVRAEADGHGMSHDLKYAADGVSRFQRCIHLGHHFGLHCRIHAAQRRFDIRIQRANFVPRCGAFQAHVTHLNRVAGNFRAEFPQQHFCESARRHARRRFPRRSPLQDVSRIMKIEFLRAGQVRMAGPWRYQLSRSRFRRVRSFHRQNLLPIGPVAILDANSYRRANRLPVPHAREHLRAVFLDLLPPAAPVSQLPPVQLVIDEVQVHTQSRRQA